MVTEITSLLIPIIPHKVPITVQASVLVLFFVFATQFIIYSANTNPDGSYAFNAGNFFFSSVGTTSLISYFLCNESNQRLFRALSMRELLYLFLARSMGSLADITQLVGLSFCDVQIASAIWFSKTIMTSICVTIMKKYPGLNDMLLNFGMSMLLLTFTTYTLRFSNKNSEELMVGMVMLFFAMFLYAICDVGTNIVLGSRAELSESAASFWGNILSLPVYYGLGICFTGGRGTDFIPFYGYNMMTWLLLVINVLFYGAAITVTAYNVRLFVSAAYAGTFAQIVLSHVIDRFQGFDSVSFTLSTSICVFTIASGFILVDEHKCCQTNMIHY